MVRHPNVGLVERMYEALARGDYAAASEMFAEDAVWHLPGGGPLSGDHRGRRAIIAAMRRFEELAGGTLRVDVHDILGSDRHAVALLHATARRGGKRYDSLEVDVFHVEGGRIREFWSLAQDQRLTDEFWS